MLVPYWRCTHTHTHTHTHAHTRTHTHTHTIGRVRQRYQQLGACTRQGSKLLCYSLCVRVCPVYHAEPVANHCDMLLRPGRVAAQRDQAAAAAAPVVDCVGWFLGRDDQGAVALGQTVVCVDGAAVPGAHLRTHKHTRMHRVSPVLCRLLALLNSPYPSPHVHVPERNPTLCGSMCDHRHTWLHPPPVAAQPVCHAVSSQG